MKLSFLFEDDEVCVVDKPAGLATIPERLNPEAANLRKLAETATGTRLWIVHRLDKETSGLVVFAKTAQAHKDLCRAFENRSVAKTYLAWVHGAWEGTGVCSAPLREFGSGRVAVDRAGGKASETGWRVLEATAAMALVELSPRTGRRHQLRAHLFYLGHPIVGDPLYGEASLRGGYRRMYLHAVRLEIARNQKPGITWVSEPEAEFGIAPTRNFVKPQ